MTDLEKHVNQPGRAKLVKKVREKINELGITYIYYQNADYFSTLKFARKFQTLYPKNENIAYIDFLIAMTFYEQVQIVARDQTYTKAALKEFRNIVKKYPTSKYAKESELKIDLINEQLKYLVGFW